MGLCGIVLILTMMSSITTLSCLDENGDKKDWIVDLRMHTKSMDDERMYVRWDSQTDKNFRNLKLGEDHIQTMFKQIDYNQHNYQAYNDEHPGSSYSHGKDRSAHAKGVLVQDPKDSTGFWWIHSVPKFPNFVSKEAGFDYVTPLSSSYGQSFLCISLDKQTQFDEIRNLLTVEHASMYVNTFQQKIDSQIQFGDKKKILSFSSLSNLKLKTKMKEFLKLKDHDVDLHITELTPDWKAFTKPPHREVQIWESAIVPHYKKTFLVETWGRPWLDSICSSEDNYNLSNVIEMQYGDQKWSNTMDHSKWGVSQDSQVLCIGDINRQETQQFRGGSIFCIENPQIASQFNDLIIQDYCYKNL